MKTLFKPILILVLLLWTMGGGVLTVYAEIPHLINYQGKLTETDGSPITATKQIIFRIYNVLSGGAPLWEETQPITINKGVFSTMLGSTVDLNLPFDQPYYLEIKVADEVMTPRQRIASAGYAFRAEEVDSIPRGVIVMWSGAITNIPNGWALADGTNGTPDLRSRFVRGAAAGVNPGGIGGSVTSGSHVLSTAEMPSHSHKHYSVGGGTERLPRGSGSYDTAANSDEHTAPAGDVIGNTGGGGGHTHPGNEPPYYDIAYIIKT